MTELQRVAILDPIDRLMHDPQPNCSLELQELRRDYNQVVVKMHNGVSVPPHDILDIFPSEVWIQIVKDALPVQGYSAALLLLTMVSTKWLQLLSSVPTLWACIDLRGSQEDSLATIETFKQLSGGASLHVSIYIPTYHDKSVIFEILTSIGPRLREMTIRRDANSGWRYEGVWRVLQLFMTKSNFNTNLVYIQLDGVSVRLCEKGGQLLTDHQLPRSLRAIRGLCFTWREFQTQDYLERVEHISSDRPIEFVLSRRIQLPNLRSLEIYEPRTFNHSINAQNQEEFPLLSNLTTLVYQSSYREILIQLLLSVAPQLVHLELRIPHSKIPLLAAGLQAAAKLRKLAVDVEERIEDQVDESDLAPVYQHRGGETSSLRDLTLRIIPGDSARTPSQGAHRGSFLKYLVSMISALYTRVERLALHMNTKYPITIEETLLLYVSCLPHLRRLRLLWPPGEFSITENTYPAEKLEYLETTRMDLLHCLRTPNLLCLKFTWQHDGNLKAITYQDLRRLSVGYNGTRSPMGDLPESGFPSLQHLTFLFTSVFGTHDIYGGFKLASFPVLTSITIASKRYEPQGTMLCFALLYQPDKCPMLNEIKFRRCFPDWDILFLMLERRNFMVDNMVSLIRRITLPFIPPGLRTPLASLLRGVYTERPLDNDLFMGGARKLLLDEQVLGCFECLLSMVPGCKCPVRRVEEVNNSYELYNDAWWASHGASFAWTGDTEYGDHTAVEWVAQRKLLLDQFSLKLVAWRAEYRREVSCGKRDDGMEITEYGINYGDCSDFTEFH